MGTYLKLYFCFLAVVLCNVDFIQGKKPTVVCYMTAWASTKGLFNVTEADTKHCTHVIYAFIGINPNTSEIQSIDPTLDFEDGGKGKGQLKKLKTLKNSNRDIKILASIGGFGQGSIKFSDMARSSSRKPAFINSVIKFIRDWELDGIDICWQFPGQFGGKADDRRNFVSLLKEMKQVFLKEGWLLTVHIVAKRVYIGGYDVRSISNIVDYINLAAVEYHGPWEKTTGIMAPLNSTNENNVAYMVNSVLERGAEPSKVLLGLPTYGHAYIANEEIRSNKYLNVPSNNAYESPWTKEKGIIAYFEVCTNLKNDSGWTEGFDEESFTPFAYKDNIFVSFDNEKSLIEKAKLVKSHQLGGIMLWSLDMDDFRGLCDNKTYPMLSAVTEFLTKEGEGASDKIDDPFSVKSSVPKDNKQRTLNVSQSNGNKQITLNSSQPKDNKKLSVVNNSGSQVYQLQILNIITMLMSSIVCIKYL